jgi:hypothetical protein
MCKLVSHSNGICVSANSHGDAPGPTLIGNTASTQICRSPITEISVHLDGHRRDLQRFIPLLVLFGSTQAVKRLELLVVVALDNSDAMS